MKLKHENYIEYKGKPLVREGEVLYYGFINDPFILRLDIVMRVKDGNPAIVFGGICPTNDVNKPIKQLQKQGLYEALDIGGEWLSHEIKKALS